MKIEQFDAATNSDRLQSCIDTLAAAQRADDPGLPVRSRSYFRARWTTGFGQLGFTIASVHRTRELDLATR